jgi:hypothetical protein
MVITWMYGGKGEHSLEEEQSIFAHWTALCAVSHESGVLKEHQEEFGFLNQEWLSERYMRPPF